MSRDGDDYLPLLTPGSQLDLGKGDPGSYPASELGAENDKANDKLVDLVSLLTNKINKNVKEIQVDIIDHYDNTNKKFDNIEEVNGDRVKELTKQVDERKEANKALRSKIAELQKKQKGMMEKYVDMENGLEQFKGHHEQISNNMDDNFKKHESLLKKFELKENQIKEDFESRFKVLNKEFEAKVTEIQTIMEVNKNSTSSKIEQNTKTTAENQKDTEMAMKKINVKLDDHEVKHKAERETIQETSKSIDDLIEKSEEKFREHEKNQMSNDNTHTSLKNQVTNHFDHCQEIMKNFKQKIAYIENELKENVLVHNSFGKQLKESDSKLRKLVDETEAGVEDIKKSIVLFEKSQHRLNTIVQECNQSNKKQLESQTSKVADINKEINGLGKEIFEIKITVKENKEADDKNQAGVNKKLQDIFSAKGSVNDQLNNLLYSLTNAEVAIEENNRNTLNQLAKFKKFQSQISEDFTKQFSVLEKLLDEFTTETKKAIVVEKRGLEGSCRDNNDEFKESLNSLTANINNIKAELQENLKNVKNDFQDFRTSGKRELEERISQLYETVNKLGSKEVNPAVNDTKEFKHKIKELEKKIRDMTNTIEEWPREWQHNLLFHGVPVPDKESFYTKAKVVSEIIRKTLGIRREVLITGLTRLIPVEHEIGGWPPISVSFQYPEDREEVLSKGGAVRGSNIQITADMTRTMREGWGELNKFMAKVKERYPGSQCQLLSDRLYVDGRMFVWIKKGEKVEEQIQVTIPASGDVITSIEQKLREPKRVQLDDLEMGR